MLFLDYFNPHSHKGSDCYRQVNRAIAVFISIHTPTRGVTVVNSNLEMQVVFQSTLPQGEWHLFRIAPSRIKYFNPHSHKGSDLIWSSVIDIGQISIHTPTRGVTSYNLCGLYFPLFQSTLPQGEWRRHSKQCKSTFDYFNPHSHKGSDISCCR